MSSVTLRENEWRRLDLSAVQLEQLVATGQELAGRKAQWRAGAGSDYGAQERSVIQILAAGGGQFKVSVANAIGVVALSGLTIRVVPKIDVEHFLYIASHALEIDPRLSDVVASVNPDSHLHEVLARALIGEAQRSLRLGLHRGYSDRPYEAAAVRGRVDMVATSRQVLRGRMRVRGHADEFVADTPLNRLVKEALGRISVSRRLSDATTGSARVMLADLAEVGRFKSSDLTPTLSRSQAVFARLADLARIVVEAGGIGIADGSTPVESFLISTPGLVEAGVRQLLGKHLVPYEVQKQGGGRVLVKSPSFSVHPDLLITKAPLTGDVKYQVARGGWNRSAVAQAVLFAAAYQSPLGFIVGFADREADSLPRLAVGSISVHEIWWPAIATVAPEAAAEIVAANVRAAIVAAPGSVGATVERTVRN